jgi:hypothetical protein
MAWIKERLGCLSRGIAYESDSPPNNQMQKTGAAAGFFAEISARR